MNGEVLEVVEEYKYLGTVFERSGKINQEINYRIGQARKIYYQLNQSLIRKKEVSQKAKQQIFNTVYKPTLLYGSESWAVNSKTGQKITAAEMKFLRRISNKTKRDLIRNTKIRDDLKVKPILNEIESKQLKWYGHVKRMEKGRIPKKILETRMEGKRGRGRPRTTWMDNVHPVLGRKERKP